MPHGSITRLSYKPQQWTTFSCQASFSKTIKFCFIGTQHEACGLSWSKEITYVIGKGEERRSAESNFKRTRECVDWCMTLVLCSTGEEKLVNKIKGIYWISEVVVFSSVYLCPHTDGFNKVGFLDMQVDSNTQKNNSYSAPASLKAMPFLACLDIGCRAPV